MNLGVSNFTIKPRGYSWITNDSLNSMLSGGHFLYSYYNYISFLVVI